MKHCASVPKMSDFWTLNPRSTQIPLTYQHKNFNIYKLHHSESTPSVPMSIEHHHSVLFMIHEQSMMVRLHLEITLLAWLSLHLICIRQNQHTQASVPLKTSEDTVTLQGQSTNAEDSSSFLQPPFTIFTTFSHT
jgi:hypothetical protein